MKTIEFETQTHNGVVEIPKQYREQSEGKRVKVIVLDSSESRDSTQPKPILTAQALLNSGLIGLWADRTDISGSLEYARQLREQAQPRGDQL